MLHYYMTKIPSRYLYNIQIYRKGTEFGNLNFQVRNSEAILNNIEIKDRNKGYGSFLLKQFESYVTNIYNVNNISLLAWQPSGDSNVVDFFNKHGYNEYDCSEKQLYDDSVIIYNLHKMRKDF